LPQRGEDGIIGQIAGRSKRGETTMPHSNYRLSDFDFALPTELIAQRPAPERSASRLLHVDGALLEDMRFDGLPGLLVPGDVLVFNDTRVVKSRIFGRKPTGGQVELMLERIDAPDRAWMQMRSSHPPRAGGSIELPAGAVATVIERDGRFFLLRLNAEVSFREYLDRHGEVPLPPYIARPVDGADSERYQTV
jgi:S-adenosylmethionine:tRNA ribosyltransferase-isomerase